ncbi:hypothetical protein KS4_23870 [Poriferisphaera corsica]|uniref:Uncharacterized protein n=1 Tax=Poriferisphaera corsica TaxID=2528020 RepID=A0A517YVT0_9BACT|nr:hypothetical protein [Poriferisphaera corsica]QDU34319.1 hypothetical protein KS4_23870 [Poriferisphaera corsica]
MVRATEQLKRIEYVNKDGDRFTGSRIVTFPNDYQPAPIIPAKDRPVVMTGQGAYQSAYRPKIKEPVNMTAANLYKGLIVVISIVLILCVIVLGTKGVMQ